MRVVSSGEEVTEFRGPDFDKFSCFGTIVKELEEETLFKVRMFAQVIHPNEEVVCKVIGSRLVEGDIDITLVTLRIDPPDGVGLLEVTFKDETPLPEEVAAWFDSKLGSPAGEAFWLEAFGGVDWGQLDAMLKELEDYLPKLLPP